MPSSRARLMRLGYTDQRVLAPPPPREARPRPPRPAWPPHVPSGGVITSTSGRIASSVGIEARVRPRSVPLEKESAPIKESAPAEQAPASSADIDGDDDDPPEAASCSRRHASVSKPVPSTMTTPAAPMRIACSAHQTRCGTGSRGCAPVPPAASRTKVKRSKALSHAPRVDCIAEAAYIAEAACIGLPRITPPSSPANVGVSHCKAHASPSRDG